MKNGVVGTLSKKNAVQTISKCLLGRLANDEVMLHAVMLRAFRVRLEIVLSVEARTAPIVFDAMHRLILMGLDHK